MSNRTKGATNGRPSDPATVPHSPVPLDHEQLVLRRGERSGLHVIIAVHSIVLGPALGGVRMWPYAGTADAVRDALRLAQGMTLKAAAAGVDLGGGKGVICLASGRELTAERRRKALLDFADLVESLDGRYITAEDVGTGTEDMAVIATRTSHVTGLPVERGGSGDPSPFTALGVLSAIRACCRHQFGSPDLAGRRVVVAGLGHVGSKLARLLAEAGAELIVSDIDPAKRGLAADLGARWVPPTDELLVECDVLAPCALGGAIDARNVADLRCAVVCGAANNQLADEGLAETLAERSVLYAPDFVVNAGGLINVYREIRGYDADRARALVRRIEQTIGLILSAASERGVTPLAAARELAEERLVARAPSPPAEADRVPRAITRRGRARDGQAAERPALSHGA